MRKIIILLTTCMLIFASCNKEKQFDEDLRVAYQKMEITYMISVITCSDIAGTWRTAIFDKKTPSGEYCSDFNDALNELFDGYRRSGILDSLSNHKNAMQVATSKLNNPPSSRKDCYDDFVEIVSEVGSISRMATDPSGNLSSYSEQMNETTENISKKLDQFKIKYGELIKNDGDS